MKCDGPAFDSNDADDFQRWYFGGSPPESDAWECRTFAGVLEDEPWPALAEPLPSAVVQARAFGFEAREPFAAV